MIVVNFSKKTGDYTSLSAIDLRVMALTYMLEVQVNGTKRLRKEPIKVIKNILFSYYNDPSYFIITKT